MASFRLARSRVILLYLFCSKVSFFVKKVNWTMIFMQLAKNNPTYWWMYYYYTRLFISILLVVGCGGGDKYMSNVFGIGFLFPPADFVLFCIWYLIFICLVSKRYLFSIFSVSIWYLIDTKWTLDTQLHPWIRQPFAFLNAGVVLVVVVERSDNVEAQLLLITSLTWRIESNRIETVGEAVLHNSAFLRLLIIKLSSIHFCYLKISQIQIFILARATKTTNFYVSLYPYKLFREGFQKRIL